MRIEGQDLVFDQAVPVTDKAGSPAHSEDKFIRVSIPLMHG